MREGSIKGRPEREAREVKVSAGSSGEDRSIGKGEGNGWELGRAHEVAGQERVGQTREGGHG